MKNKVRHNILSKKSVNFSEIGVGPVALTSVSMRSSNSRNITSCCPMKVNRHFGRTYHFRFQGLTVTQVRNQHEAGTNLLLLFFNPENGSDIFFRNFGCSE
jgi:hypothetical protein